MIHDRLTSQSIVSHNYYILLAQHNCARTCTPGFSHGLKVVVVTGWIGSKDARLDLELALVLVRLCLRDHMATLVEVIGIVGGPLACSQASNGSSRCSSDCSSESFNVLQLSKPLGIQSNVFLQDIALPEKQYFFA